MKNMNKINRGGEQGVALVFALGILALLMIMLTAFVSSMLLQRQTSETMSRSGEANALAESAISHALSTIQLIANLAESGSSQISRMTNFNRVVSITPSPKENVSDSGNLNDGGRVYEAKLLMVEGLYEPELDANTTGSNKLVNDYTRIKYENESSMDAPHWILVRDGAQNNAADADRIIGRFAYAVAPDFIGKINLNSAWGAQDTESSKDGGNTVSGRGGKNFNDIDVADIINNVKEANDSAQLGNPRTSLEAFTVLSEYFRGDSGQDLALKDIRKYLTVGSQANASGANEFYWIDKNGDGMVQSKDELFARLNFNTALNNIRGKESNLRVDLLMNGSGDIGSDRRVPFYKEKVGSEGENVSGYEAVDISAMGNVPLKPFFDKFTSSRTFSNVNALKNQIAANMIDFFADDTKDVTSDIVPKAWSPKDAQPSYTGNKRTCYINEVAAITFVTVDVARVIGDATKVKVTVSVKPRLYCEIVDIYGKDTDDYQVTMHGDVMSKWYADGYNILDYDYSIPQTKKMDISIKNGQFSTIFEDTSRTNLNPGYYVGMVKLDEQSKSQEISVGNSMNPQVVLEMKDIGFSVDGVVLARKNEESYENVDFAKIKTLSQYGEISPDSSIQSVNQGIECIGFTNLNIGTGNTTKSIKVNLGVNTHYFYIISSLEVEDPRQNLNQQDWVAGKIVIDKDNKVGFGKANVSDNISLGMINNPQRQWFKSIDVTKGDKESISPLNGDLGGTVGDLGQPSAGNSLTNRLSTAYIKGGRKVTGKEGDTTTADAELESLWELGAVHRGVKWQTLNLKNAGTLDSDGRPASDDYELGDAELLDYIFIDGGNSAKLDINARNLMKDGTKLSADNVKTWQSVFKVKQSDDYEDFDAGNNTFSFSGIDSLPSDSNFKRRSELANIISNIGSVSGAANDAEQESVFGKTANLLEARNNFPAQVQLIVVAQVIDDVGGSETDINGNVTAKDMAVTKYIEGVRVEKKDCRIGQIDEVDNVSIKVNDEGGTKTINNATIMMDNVVATQRMLVTLDRRMTDGKYVVTGIEYLD